MIDYAKFDASKRWMYKQDLLDKAVANGCQHITEFAHQCYKKSSGYIEASKLFGFTPEPFRKLLVRIGVKMNQRGGYRRN